jgi:hypothetical protein
LPNKQSISFYQDFSPFGKYCSHFEEFYFSAAQRLAAQPPGHFRFVVTILAVILKS